MSVDPQPAAIELRAAEKLFAHGGRGVAPISLAVSPGEFLSVIGPSGCGKSTVLKLMAHLEHPTRGTVNWWGGGFSCVGTRGRRLAFVFQDPTLMPWASIHANVRLPLDLSGKRDSDADEKTTAALAMVDLVDCARAHPAQLSGGMRMRASIARALVTEPDLLLMDEPFGALDEVTRDRLDEDLQRLSYERHLTTVFVTHSIYEAVFLSTRVAIMAGAPGRLFAEHSIDEPQPRDEAFRLSDRYTEHCRTVYGLLKAAFSAGRHHP